MQRGKIKGAVNSHGAIIVYVCAVKLSSEAVFNLYFSPHHIINSKPEGHLAASAM